MIKYDLLSSVSFSQVDCIRLLLKMDTNESFVSARFYRTKILVVKKCPLSHKDANVPFRARRGAFNTPLSKHILSSRISKSGSCVYYHLMKANVNEDT